MKYVFTPEMGEISGFGGGYEKACRKMLRAACLWLDKHPRANPKFSQYSNIYGVIDYDNKSAKELSHYIWKVEKDHTGAMHQAVINHAMYIRQFGWDAYRKRMKVTSPNEKDESRRRAAELVKGFIEERRKALFTFNYFSKRIKECSKEHNLRVNLEKGKVELR